MKPILLIYKLSFSIRSTVNIWEWTLKIQTSLKSGRSKSGLVLCYKAYYTLQKILNKFLGFRVFASFLQPRLAFFIAYLGCENDAKTWKPEIIDAKTQKHV